MKERIAIIDGLRSPFVKAGGVFAGMPADELGAAVTRELLARLPIVAEDIDEVIAGNVAQPGHAANIARVIALRAGLPEWMSAYTVHRNCASGMEAITTAANKINAGEADIILTVATESMSGIPLLFNKGATRWFAGLAKARSLWQKLTALLRFRFKHLDPVIGIKLGLTDPYTGLNMGETAEVLARDFSIGRQEQDEWALLSHQRAAAAQAAGRFATEIAPLPVGPSYDHIQTADDCIRVEQSMPALAKLRAVFQRQGGTVTAGNACPITDGATAVLVARESVAEERGLPVLGYLSDYAYAGLDGKRMGLGPVYATARLFAKTGRQLADFDRIELNEAFAAQVLACRRAFASTSYAREHLNRDSALGEIDPDRLNVQGGAIALGHPVGATGMRLVTTLLTQMRADGEDRGLATLCIGGGQGAALELEAA